MVSGCSAGSFKQPKGVISSRSIEKSRWAGPDWRACGKGARPPARCLQLSDCLRHDFSTVLDIDDTLLIFSSINSATSLSMFAVVVVRGEESRRRGKGDFSRDRV